MENQTKKRKAPKIKTAEGPYKVIFILAGKEVTKDEVIAHINKCTAAKKASERGALRKIV